MQTIIDKRGLLSTVQAAASRQIVELSKGVMHTSCSVNQLHIQHRFASVLCHKRRKLNRNKSKKQWDITLARKNEISAFSLRHFLTVVPVNLASCLSKSYGHAAAAGLVRAEAASTSECQLTQIPNPDHYITAHVTCHSATTSRQTRIHSHLVGIKDLTAVGFEPTPFRTGA